MGFIAVEWLLNGIYSNYKLLQNFIDSHPLRALGAPVRVPWDFSTSEHTEPLSRSGWMGIFHTTNKEYIYIDIWLMVSTLWKIWKSDWIIIPSIWKNKTYSKPPTRIYIYGTSERNIEGLFTEYILSGFKQMHFHSVYNGKIIGGPCSSIFFSNGPCTSPATTTMMKHKLSSLRTKNVKE